MITVIVAFAVAIGILATVYIVEKSNSSNNSNNVPEDVYAAALKLQNAGYSVEIEKDNMLSLLTNEASQMYNITFSGTMTAYLQAYVSKNKELKAEIFYFTNESDAKLLYEKMKENWSFTKEQGELRYSGNVVYMGTSDALAAFEK